MKCVNIGRQDAIIWRGSKELSEHVQACTSLLRAVPLTNRGEIIMGLPDGERVERVAGRMARKRKETK